MKNHLLGVSCFAILCAGAFGATSARAETLYDAMQAAALSHPSVMAAKESQSATEATVREQRASYFPDIALSATGGRVYGDNATSRGLSVTRGAGYSGYGEGMASLSQRIYDWGETGNKVDAAKARSDAAEDTTVYTQEAIALRAAQAYVGLLRASDLKTRVAENLATIRGYQEKIAVQVQAGGSDEAELNRANDFLLLSQNAATEFEGQYQQALADYMEVVGQPPVSGLVRPDMPTAFPENVDAAIEAAKAYNPEVLAAKEAVVASDHDMRAEKTNYLPKLHSELSYMKRDQRDIIGGESEDARAVMKMDWNFSAGGAQIARVSRAVHTKAQTEAQLEETNRRIERGVRVAWSALDVVRQQQQTQQDRRDATAKVVDTYKTQYEGDKRSLIELMQAESQAFDASVAYANADFGVLNATYTVLSSVGQLLPAVQPQTQTAATSYDDMKSYPVEDNPPAIVPVAVQAADKAAELQAHAATEASDGQ